MAKKAEIIVSINTQNAIKSVAAVNEEVKGTLNTVNDLRTTVAGLEEQLEGAEFGSAEFNQLQGALIEVNKELKNYELSVESLDNEQVASEFGSMAAGITDTATSAVALSSAMGLTDESSMEMIETLGKGMAIAQGFRGGIEGIISFQKLLRNSTMLQNAAQAKSIALTGTDTAVKGAQTAATVVQTTATTGATIATRILNAVMMANPVFLLIAGIVALVAGLAAFSAATKDAEKTQEQLNAEMAEGNKLHLEMANSILNHQKRLEELTGNRLLYGRAVGKSVEGIEKELELMQAQGASMEEIYNKEQELIKAKKSRATVDLISLGQAGDSLDYMELTNNALAEMEKLIGKTDEASKSRMEILNQILDNAQIMIDANHELKVSTEEYNKEIKDDSAQKYLERRKQLLLDINAILGRQKDASSKLARVRLDFIKEEQEAAIESINHQYGEDRQSIIDIAVKREIAALEEKFLNSSMSEEAFKLKREEIVQGGADNLLAIEVELLGQKRLLADQEISSIKEDYADKERLAKENADMIAQGRLLADLQYQKELELITANEIEDESDRAEAIFLIKERYKQAEIDLVQSVSDESMDILDEQYAQEIAGLEETSEEKRKIDEKYYKDREDLARDTDAKIRELEKNSLDVADENMSTKVDEWATKNAEMISFITDAISQSIDLIGQVLEEQAARAAAQRETEFQEGSEALKAQLANREISQKQFDNRMALLEQQKEQRELAAKRKAFKQAKAIAIVNAIMGTAQAVLSAFSSAAAIPIAGVALGPIMAGVAGALGAAQIGIIASQKFQAARGGVVPGNGPSNIDSVDALLAPGETVINSQSSSMFPQLLSTINQAGGGVSLAPDVPVSGGSSNSDSVFSGNRPETTVKAYVVETEITDTQSRVNRIEKGAEF